MAGLSNTAGRGVGRAALQRTLLMAAALLFFGGTALGAPPDTMRIWRAQVRFITADVSDAGTDDSVKIELNGSNRTWLDSGRDDRERDSDETFDLRLEGVATLADIDYFRIEKTGTGGWAIARMYLILNEEVIYEEEFPSELWLDNGDGHAPVYYVEDAFMRPRSEWLSYVVPARPNVIPRNAMSRRIESVAGDFGVLQKHLEMIGGNNSVEPFTLNVDTWRVDLDMEQRGYLADIFSQDIDVDFDLRATCAAGHLDFIVSNVNVEPSTFEPYAQEEVDAAREFFAGDFRVRLNEMMKNFRFVVFPGCPAITLAPNADLHLDPQFPPTQEGSIEIADDSTAPIDINVVTGYEIKASAQTAFVATVKSKLEKDAEVDISFALPTQIAAWDTIVEVQDAGKGRTIGAKLTGNADGTSSLAFRDVVPAGRNTQYTLHLTFQPKEEGTRQLVTRIEPATPELQASITPLTATTYFYFKSDSVVAKGTAVQGSAYIASGK